MKRSRRLPRFVRLGAGALIIAAVVTGALVLLAPVVLRGERFGRLVEARLPPMRGHVHVGGGTWSWGALLALARGAPAPVSFDDVRVTDPEGTEVLFVHHLSARVELHRSPLRLRVTEIAVVDGRWRFAHLRSGRATGFLAAFAPPGARPTSTAARAAPASGSWSVSLDGVSLEGVAVVFDLPDWSLTLRDVHGLGSLDARPGAFTFDVAGADLRGGGDLRIGPLAPLTFGAGRLDRVATTRGALDAIRLEAKGLPVGRSRFDLAATFDGVYGKSPASARPSIDAEVRVDAAADLLDAVAGHRTSWRATGERGRVVARLKGPFQSLTVGAEVRGLDLENGGSIAVRDVGLDFAAEPSAGRFRVRGLSLASPAGGSAGGDVTVDGARVDGDLTFERLATAPFVPSVLRPFAAGWLDGRLRGHVDLRAGTFGLDLATLVLRRTTGGAGASEIALAAGAGRDTPVGTAGPTVRLGGLRVADGAIEVSRLTASVWGARFSAGGRVRLWDPLQSAWLPAPEIALDVAASRLSIERVTGLAFVRSALAFAARVRGSPDDLTLAISFPARSPPLTVLDEPFFLPRGATLRFKENALALEKDFRLGGPRGSELRTTGRIALGGPLDLDVAILGFPLERLPGLARTALPITGLLSGRVHVGGVVSAPTMAGDFALASLTFLGRALGGGTLAITPGPKGAIRGRGRLIDAISVDGMLVPRSAGVEGEATLTLEHLRMDPFLEALVALPVLPGGLSASGFLSGRLTVRVAPGQPAIAEGELSELALRVTPPGSSKVRPRPIELRVEAGLPFAARSGAGPISIGPARFVGDAGAFELWGEARGAETRATLRGRIALAPLAPFVRRWTSRLDGSVDVDLATALTGAGGAPDTRGTIAVAAPIGVRSVDPPVDATVMSGVVKVAGATLETVGLGFTVHAASVPIAPITLIEGRGRLFARVDDEGGGHARVGARVALDAVDVFVRELGATPVRIAGGNIELRRHGAGSFEISRVDLPLRGELRRLELAPVSIERGTFEARVEGDPDRALRLAGTVTLEAARIRPAALSGSAAGASSPIAGGRDDVRARLTLDLRLRAPDGAVVVDVARVPDLRVGLDMRVTGTAAHPKLSGEPHGSNVYSRLALALWRFFR